MFQLFTNSLWYITNQHLSISNTALKRKEILSVSSVFEKFQGYNDLKRKTLKSKSLDKIRLKSHAQTLYSILNRPIFILKKKKWLEFSDVVESLAECLSKYRDYLENQSKEQQKRRNQVNSDMSIEHRPKCHFVLMQIMKRFVPSYWLVKWL